MADALNLFLRAAGSERTFSYGSSKYYDGQTFGDMLYREWPAQTIALSLEKRLLERIATAHRAISVFMNNAEVPPSRGMPRPASPAFTDNSAFAAKVISTLQYKEPATSSPRQEDAAWASAIEGEAHHSYSRAASEVPEEQPTASTSSGPLDKGKGKDPTEIPIKVTTTQAGIRAVHAELPEGGHDADDEDEQRLPRRSRSNSHRTSTRPPSLRSPLNRRNSDTRRSSRAPTPASDPSSPDPGNAPDPPAPPSHSSPGSSTMSGTTTSHASRVSGAPNRGPRGQ